jgi:hypothetical protein
MEESVGWVVVRGGLGRLGQRVQVLLLWTGMNHAGLLIGRLEIDRMHLRIQSGRESLGRQFGGHLLCWEAFCTRVVVEGDA